MITRSKQPVKANWFILNPKLTAFLFFMLLIAIISLIVQQRYLIVKENREREIDVMLESVELRLEQLLKNSQNITLTLALTLDRNGNPHNFEEVSAEIMQDNPYLQAIQLVPNGVIKYVYPIKGNEQAIGLDLFNNSSKQNALAAKKAIARRKIYFQGPVELVQGSKGVIGRLPIFLDKKFWGFSAVVIKFDKLLKDAGIDNDNRFYKFQFSKVNPATNKEEFFLPGNYMSANKAYKIKTFEEGDWKIYLIDTRSLYADYQIGSWVLFGILLSILSSYLLLRLLKEQAQLYIILDRQNDMLLAAENKYKTIFDHAAIGIGRIDTRTGEFLEANAFLCKLLGYSAEELNRKKIKHLIHRDDLAADVMNFKGLKANKIRKFSSVRRYINKYNETIWANAIVSPLWKEDEPPSNHIVIVDDITQQVAYEKELIASQRHINDLINSIDGIVWEASVKDNFANTFVSSKVYDILGYTQEEWTSELGFFEKKVYHEDKDGIIEYIENKLFTKKYHQYEYRMLAKDGSVVWIRDSVTIEPNLEAPEKLRGIMIDITATKEVEETLHQSYELLNEQNKRLLNFSYIVSHNLRSHASNIDGITSLIKSADTDKEREEMIDFLQKVVGGLNETLYNLNNVVNIHASINIIKEPLNLREYVAKAIEAQEAHILNKRAHILNEVSPAIFVSFNRAYLESVLLNLISNAIRYSAETRTPAIVINSGNNKNGQVILTVKDNGVGIDLMKNGSKLFGLNQTFHGNSDARGLGLFITKNQIEAMGGNIGVESVLGEGTTFTITFG